MHPEEGSTRRSHPDAGAVIVVAGAFSGVLDAWLASHGKSRPRASHPRAASLTLERWAHEVHAAIARVPGPARGLEIGAHFQLQHGGPLGYLIVNTTTFAEMLAAYLQLEKSFYGRNWAHLEQDGKQVSLSWSRQFGLQDRVLEQLHIRALLTLLRSACPTLNAPLRVDMISASHCEAGAYRKAFGCPVRFRQEASRLVFPVEALQAAIDLRGAALSPAWRKRQRTLREALPDATQFVRAVQDAIHHVLPAGAGANAVAARLNLSRRTLQRRLADAGCSYRQLVDSIRQCHARQLMDDPGLSLQEIAFLLGYAEQSAFNHAHRRWHGVSPRAR